MLLKSMKIEQYNIIEQKQKRIFKNIKTLKKKAQFLKQKFYPKPVLSHFLKPLQFLYNNKKLNHQEIKKKMHHN